MSDTYTKLFSSITESTIVSEPVATRWLWVTMLAMADAQGHVFGSIPGLARRANLTIEEVEAGLATFHAPDAYSRTKDNDGRRIVDIDGGWLLLNHAKYAAIRSEAERREYKRQWDRDNRPSGHQRSQSDRSPTQSDTVRQSDKSPTQSDESDSPDHTNTNTNTKDQKHCASGDAPDRFEEFWSVYPSKVGKKPCRAKWKARKLDRLADTIIVNVEARIAKDQRWKDGFVPNPLTYLNQDRWNDPVQGETKPASPSPSSHAPYVPPAPVRRASEDTERKGMQDIASILKTSFNPERQPVSRPARQQEEDHQPTKEQCP